LVQTEKLKREIAVRDMTPCEVARHLGMSEKRFGRKLETGRFGSEEIQDLTVLLELKHPEEVFFA